jgi:uronate dehydrogenase
LTTRKILITGAAGEVGTNLAHKLPTDRYDLVLADIREPDYDHDCPFVKLDISDLDQFAAACDGVDTIVHMAADRRTYAPWETLLPANVIGAYNAFEAAHRAGCRRVIFASSIHTGSGYPADLQHHPDIPPHPGNLYGATKVWGEAVARVYADHKQLSCLCLRFGWVSRPDDIDKLAKHHALSMYFTHDDLVRLVIACIDAPDDLMFGIFNGISNNRYKKMDITNARKILGYDPQDDAFELQEYHLKK